jgi:tetratricopeptide (TPR) repeat protein
MAAPVLSERDLAVLRSFARRIDPSDAGAHNNLGVLYFQKGLIDDAMGAFTRALELDPKMLVAQRNLEIAYHKTGYYDRRVAELTERLRVRSDDRDARWELGRTYASLGQQELAIEEFQALVAKAPDDVAVLIQLGLAEKTRGRLEEASEWFNRALELDAQSSVIHFYIGETCYNRGLSKEALEALTRATELTPDHADAHYLLAFVLGDLGRHEEARAASKRAIQLNPNFARAQTNLSLEKSPAPFADRPEAPVPEVAPGVALAHFNLGLAFRQKGYYIEALREYRTALDAGEDRRLVLQAIAEVHLLRRDYPVALELYERLLEETPDSPKLWNERGVVLHQLGRLPEALESYGHAVEHAPGYALALNNLAVAHAVQGRYDEAVDRLREALSSQPFLVIPGINLGLLLFRSAKVQLSLQAFRKVLELDPACAPAWNGLGLILNELGRVADGRNAFARAVEADPGAAEGHYNLSFALSALGDYDGALREVTRAQEIDPYYTPQKFQLLIDLQYESPTIAIVPEISGDVSTELAPQSLKIEQGAVDQLFRGLERRAPGTQRSIAAEDPFALAREYLGKGLLELAAAETSRAVNRGADPMEGHALAGEIFARRGLHGEALERFRAARAGQPERRDARFGEVRALLALGRGSEAVQDAEVLAQETPGDVDVQMALASSRLAAGNPAGALDALRVARERAPQRADILKLEGDIALSLGNTQGALDAYQAALALDARYVQVHVDLGRTHEVRSDLRAAEASFRSALDILPTHAEGVLALANLYRRTGSPRGAVNLLVDYLTTDPSDVHALLALGRALLEDNRLDAALEVLRRVLAFDDKHSGAMFFAGVVLAQLKQYREAVGMWERVIAVDPAGPFAQEARRHARTALDLQHIFRSEAA